MFEADLSFQKGTVIVLGTLDGIHLGHQRLIEAGVALKNSHDLHALALTFGRPPKGAPLLMTPQRKEALLYSMGIDQIFELDFDAVQDLSPEEFFCDILRDTFNARAVVCGSDYRFGKNAAGTAAKLKKLCEQNGVEITVCKTKVALRSKVSSTRVRDLLLSGDTIQAQKLLSRPFCLDGEVLEGRQLGRTLGYPTINQKIESGLLIPKEGVYATVCELDGTRYPAVTNIGPQPTVGGMQPTVETHIIGFDGDLYGRYISVDFYERLRDIYTYSDLSALQDAITNDAVQAETLFQKRFH